MRLASISDLHLGPSVARERFVQDESVLIRFFQQLQETHDRIVIVGDLYQADYGLLPGRRPDIVSQIRGRYSRLIELLDQPIVEILVGNHDLVSCPPPDRLVVEADSMRIVFLHGHEFDPIASGTGSVLSMWLSALLREAGLPGLAEFFEGRILEPLHRRLMGGEQLGLDVVAERVLTQTKANVVVMGHSHVPALERRGPGLYANSGVSHGKSLRFVSIDTRIPSVSIQRFDTDSHVCEVLELAG